jgi:hypothetical protein
MTTPTVVREPRGEILRNQTATIQKFLGPKTFLAVLTGTDDKTVLCYYNRGFAVHRPLFKKPDLSEVARQNYDIFTNQEKLVGVEILVDVEQGEKLFAFRWGPLQKGGMALRPTGQPTQPTEKKVGGKRMDMQVVREKRQEKKPAKNGQALKQPLGFISVVAPDGPDQYFYGPIGKLPENTFGPDCRFFTWKKSRNGPKKIRIEDPRLHEGKIVEIEPAKTPAAK